MKSLKLILLGIALLLFGICSILLCGLEGTPLFHNGIYELLGVFCPIPGLILAAAGFFLEEKKDGK